jgi:hypothetical protein
MSDVAEALLRVMAALDDLGICYLIGGSVASSVHGEPRASRDVDIVADLSRADLPRLAAKLQPEFYADPDMMLDCVRRGRAFNVIHIATACKFDVFPLADDPYSAEQLARRVSLVTSALGAPLTLPLSSAEDTLLAKLVWFRAGGEVSERQWNDVRGVFAVQRDRLDLAYLRRWATKLGVLDLLDRQLKEQQA